VSSSSSASAAPVALGAVLRDAVHFWRVHIWYLTAISAVLWLPLAVLELTGLAHGIEIDTDHFRPADVVVNVVIVLVFELLVAEVLAAASEKIVADDLHGVGLPSYREFLAGVPWVSLVTGTLIYEIGVGVGLLFFVIPGLVVAVWGVVTGPVIVAEGCRALRAPGRSRELVRGSFLPVALFVFLAFVLSEMISNLAGALLDLFSQTWAEPTGEYFVHVITSPLFGMATAVLYYALLARERADAQHEPAEAGSSKMTASPPKRARRK
jgi:uncharacterized membrane protein YhaH (DUF805 family)